MPATTKATLSPGVSEVVAAAIEAGDVSVLEKHKSHLPSLGVLWGPSETQPVLNFASRRGSEEVVAKLIESGCPINEVDGSGATPLGQALNRSRETSSVAIVRRLLDAGAPVNGAIYTDGTPPLTIAVMNDAIEIVALLLERGAENTEHHEPPITPLETAVARSRPEVVKLFLEKFQPKSLSAGAKERLLKDMDRWIRMAEAGAERPEPNPRRDPQERIESAKQVKAMVLEWFEKGNAGK